MSLRQRAPRPARWAWVVALALGAGLVSLVACSRGEIDEAARQAVPIGTQVGMLEFVDSRFLPRSLADLGPAEAVVLVFTAGGCPLVERYLPRLGALEREFRPRGAVFLGVNASPDSVLEAAAQGITPEVDFHFVKDFGGRVVEAVGATRTPQVVVLDAEHVLRYRGRIDSQYRLGGARPNRGREDLREALEDVLAGRAVRVPETPVDGCPITLEKIAPDRGLTWYADVRPIFEQNCWACHRPDGVAPFSLVSHQDVQRRRRVVEEVVRERRMPPWFALPGHMPFENELPLSDAERRTVLAWFAAGAPAGEPESPEDSEPTLPPLGEWGIGEPDMVLSAPSFELPSEGFLDYEYVILPHTFERDTWIEALEVLPTDSTILHHAQVMFVEGPQDFDDHESWVPASRLFAIYVPGRGPMELEPGIAMLIPANSVLGLQLHYVPSGRATVDATRVGLRFPRTAVRQRLRMLTLTDFDFEVAPGDPAHRIQLEREPRERFRMQAHSMLPHMHLRGRDIRVRALIPGGREVTLLDVPSYSFDWQFDYRWARDSAAFPPGTRFELSGRLDNSAFNPYNPDPSVTVRFGEATTDEMFYCWLFYTVAGENLGIRVDPRTGQSDLPTPPGAFGPRHPQGRRR